MCDPVSATMAVLAIAGSAMSVDAQRETAKAQQKAADNQAQDQAEELAAQRDEQIGQRVAEARRNAARRLVIAGEAGVAGQSTEIGVLSEFGAANQDSAKVSKQAAFAHRANMNQYRATLANIHRPNDLEAGLQIVNSGVQGAAAGRSVYNSFKKPNLTIGGGP
jgi:hypothetical protein